MSELYRSDSCHTSIDMVSIELMKPLAFELFTQWFEKFKESYEWKIIDPKYESGFTKLPVMYQVAIIMEFSMVVTNCVPEHLKHVVKIKYIDCCNGWEQIDTWIKSYFHILENHVNTELFQSMGLKVPNGFNQSSNA